MTEREFAIDVVRTLQRAGFTTYWAGGCVRDELLELTPADYDVATNAIPQQVQALFRRTVEVGISFGVVEVLGPRSGDDYLKVQVATFRADGPYVDGRWPTHVTFCSAEEDASRRDFTINGMFFDPLEGKLIDYVGGRDDLTARVLRAIRDPVERFTEDKLRMLRAVRLAPRFGLSIDPPTAAAIQLMADQITVVSAERIADELRKMLVHPRRAEALKLMDSLGLVQHLLPDLLEMKDLPQGLPTAPTGDLWAHVMRVLELLDGPEWPERGEVSFPLAFGTLLHDIGKRRTMGRTPDRYTFHGHEHIGKDMAEKIARRLKLSNDEVKRITWLVERHQYLCDASKLRRSRLLPILIHPGIGELLALHRADSLATGRDVEHVEFCLKVLRETPPEVLNPPPLVTGDDLLALGLKQGPKFKQWLDAIREAQLEQTIRTKEEGLALLSGEWGVGSGE